MSEKFQLRKNVDGLNRSCEVVPTGAHHVGTMRWMSGGTYLAFSREKPTALLARKGDRWPEATRAWSVSTF